MSLPGFSRHDGRLTCDLQKTRAIQSSRTAFVLEAVIEKGMLGPLDPTQVAPSPEPRRP